MSSAENSTRHKILQAAWELLEAGDPGKARLGDIAKRAGVSRQALYLHFANRADLLTQTARFIDEQKGVDARLEASRNASTGRERLREYCRFWAGYLPEIHGVASAFMAMEYNDEDARTAWADRMEGLRHGCQAAISALQRDGDLRSDISEADCCDILWTMMSVPNWQRFTASCGWSQERYARWLIDSAEKLLLNAARLR